MINIFRIKKTEVVNGCDCWGRSEFDYVYDVYHNDEFVCRMMNDPTVLVDKMNDILIAEG